MITTKKDIIVNAIVTHGRYIHYIYSEKEWHYAIADLKDLGLIELGNIQGEFEIYISAL